MCASRSSDLWDEKNAVLRSYQGLRFFLVEEFLEFFLQRIIAGSKILSLSFRRPGCDSAVLPGSEFREYCGIACAPELKNAERSSFASSLMTISTPKGVSSLVRDETREESFGFFGLLNPSRVRELRTRRSSGQGWRKGWMIVRAGGGGLR
jgi:hypothetical protein